MSQAKKMKEHEDNENNKTEWHGGSRVGRGDGGGEVGVDAGFVDKGKYVGGGRMEDGGKRVKKATSRWLDKGIWIYRNRFETHQR